MKFKTNFKDMREAVVTIGKAVKKNMSPIEISLVKIEAGEDYVELSTNGSIGACVKIQAVVEEAGSFVTSFSGINILSVRKCDGDINASNEVNENTLVLKYRGGKAWNLLLLIRYLTQLQTRLMTARMCLCHMLHLRVCVRTQSLLLMITLHLTCMPSR